MHNQEISKSSVYFPALHLALGLVVSFTSAVGPNVAISCQKRIFTDLLARTCPVSMTLQSVLGSLVRTSDIENAV